MMAAKRGSPVTSRLVLFAHGSRDPRWREPFERLAKELERELGKGQVGLAYMEFVPPTLEDTAVRAVGDGIRRLKLLPLFMAAGGHVDRDIPEQVTAVRSRFPELDIEVLPPIGEHPRFSSFLRELAAEAARG